MRSLLPAGAAACLALTCMPVTAQPSHSVHDGWVSDAITLRSADGVQLSGSLVTPEEGRPIAVIVLVHGSGPSERYTALAALLALRRVAVLTYDKRGVGQSGGRYERVNDVSRANLELMASDATAAMKWVLDSPILKALPRGFVGLSQAGWVVPIAVARLPTVDFIGFWSGPTCTTSEQLHLQHFSAEHESDWPRVTADMISEAMLHVEYRPDDVDPRHWLKAVSVPGIWLFGGQDPYVPIALSTRRLQQLIDNGRSNFEYRVFPEEGHNLADSPRQASFVTMVDWIEGIALSSR